MKQFFEALAVIRIMNLANSLHSNVKLHRGFTLIELLVVIVVITILAAILLFGLNLAQKRARDTQRLSIIRGVNNALQAHLADTSSYPATGWTTTLFTGSLNPYLGGTSPLKDPGCGAGTVDVKTTATPCGAGGAVTYSYGTTLTSCPAGSPVEVRVTKEAGGTASSVCGAGP